MFEGFWHGGIRRLVDNQNYDALDSTLKVQKNAPDTLGLNSRPMHSVISLVALLSFMAHAIFGCCSHHEHTADEICIQHQDAHHDHLHAGHDHDDSPTEELPENSPCPAKQCCGSHCSFMAAAKVNWVKLQIVALLPISTGDLVADLCDPLAATVIDSGGLIEPPLRLHLFNQVLQI